MGAVCHLAFGQFSGVLSGRVQVFRRFLLDAATCQRTTRGGSSRYFEEISSVYLFHDVLFSIERLTWFY
jgi:hypothetical protein